MMHTLDLWLKARRDYIQGKGFLPDIAKKYGIPVQTVQTRGKRERWSQARAQFIAKKNEMPELEPPAAPPPPQNIGTDYVSQKLTRVRLQLARLDDMLDAEVDPQRIDKLASAIARLSELERQWSDRPMPGTKKVKEISRRMQAYTAREPLLEDQVPAAATG